jgi:hypothetical protein
MARLGHDAPGPVPFDLVLIRLASSWGVPPWALTGEEDTPENRSLWVHRGLIFQRIEG